MTVDQMITMARNQSGIKETTSVTNDIVADYLTIARNQCINRFAAQKKHYIWDLFTTDTVASQNEYTLQAADSTTE
jgi:hypothetical protein